MSIKTNRKQRRVRRALAMYYGTGSYDEHTYKEIAEELDVRVRTVKQYIEENPIAKEVDEALDAVAEQTRREIVMDLRQRLDSLSELESELMGVVETEVTSFTFEEVEGTVKDTPTYGVTVDEGQEKAVDTQVPVPREVKEVPQFERLQEVWDEKRRTQEQLVNLLGLEEPDEVQVSGEVTERKVWKGVEESDDNELPDQDVIDVDSEDSV